MDAKIRLYVDQPLGAGQSVPLDRAQAHYLFGVMRQDVGAQVLLFNGTDGEWLAHVAEAGKRGGVAVCAQQIRPVQMPPDLWLCFAPLKKARTDFIVEKACEMGAARIVPMQTEFTNSGRIQRDRLQAHAVEAAEQCGGTYVPEVMEMQRFGRLLEGWDPARHIMFCDELLASSVPASLLGEAQASSGPASLLGETQASSGPASLLGGAGAPWAIFIGPEGGFSQAERMLLTGMEQSVAVSLGPRILRADTAAVAAMTIWQQARGDWR
jgi:16S rRNA (uracil1498-N3)-methyltransferase